MSFGIGAWGGEGRKACGAKGALAASHLPRLLILPISRALTGGGTALGSEQQESRGSVLLVIRLSECLQGRTGRRAWQAGRGCGWQDQEVSVWYGRPQSGITLVIGGMRRKF
jgi:hypothetical protein